MIRYDLRVLIGSKRDMTKININDFGLDSDDNPPAVEELFNKMSSLQIAKLNIAHGSAFQFIQDPCFT